MTKTIIFILTVLIAQSAIGQINQTIVFDTTKYYFPKPGKWDFVGTFEFESLPQPLKNTRVNFELVAIRDDPDQVTGGDWQIRLLHQENVAKVVSDTLFTWPGPHKRGDRFTGVIEFIPLMSGNWTMILVNNCTGRVPAPEIMIYRGISFQWCLDEDGELHSLDQFGIQSACTGAKTVFLTSDTLHFMQFPHNHGAFLCDYEIFITPIPHIDDTSTIIFNLKANARVTPLFDVAIGTNSTDILYEVKNFDFSMPSGDSLIFPVRFVPRLVGQICSINLVFNDRSPNSDRKYQRQSISCGFIFGNDGRLRYCGAENFGSVPEEKYPKVPYRRDHPLYVPKDTTVILHRHKWYQ